MQQLTGLDEMFLSLDTGPTTGHISGIAVFPAPDEQRDELAFLRQRVRDRLPYLPLLRWSLHRAPLGVDQRYWVEAKDVDVNAHVVGLTLPKPGTPKQFQAAVDAEMAELLDRDRPMWKIVVITGMAEGKYAYLIKVTHGLADGSALWAIYDQLSDAPTEKLEAVPSQRPTGGSLGILGKGIVRAAKTPAVAAGLVVDAGKWAVARLGDERLRAVPNLLTRVTPGELSKPMALISNKMRPVEDEQVASLFPSLMPPDSPFNGAVTSNQTLLQTPFTVTELRAIGKLVDGTVNDALLAIMAAALRRYMTSHGGIPTRPLIVAAPVSWRTGKEKERWANQVWMLFIPIPTHLGDPMARLTYARDSARTAKANWERVPGHLLRRASALMPSFVMGPGAKVMARMPARLTPRMYNVSLSNVRGPKDIPVHGGRTMEGYVVYGFLSPGCGLLLGGQSLGDNMILTATVCTDVVKGYDKLPKLLEDAKNELLALTATGAK